MGPRPVPGQDSAPCTAAACLANCLADSCERRSDTPNGTRNPDSARDFVSRIPKPSSQPAGASMRSDAHCWQPAHAALVQQERSPPCSAVQGRSDRATLRLLTLCAVGRRAGQAAALQARLAAASLRGKLALAHPAARQQQGGLCHSQPPLQQGPQLGCRSATGHPAATFVPESCQCTPCLGHACTLQCAVLHSTGLRSAGLAHSLGAVLQTCATHAAGAGTPVQPLSAESSREQVVVFGPTPKAGSQPHTPQAGGGAAAQPSPAQPQPRGQPAPKPQPQPAKGSAQRSSVQASATQLNAAQPDAARSRLSSLQPPELFEAAEPSPAQQLSSVPEHVQQQAPDPAQQALMQSHEIELESEEDEEPELNSEPQPQQAAPADPLVPAKAKGPAPAAKGRVQEVSAASSPTSSAGSGEQRQQQSLRPGRCRMASQASLSWLCAPVSESDQPRCCTEPRQRSILHAAGGCCTHALKTLTTGVWKHPHPANRQRGALLPLPSVRWLF